MPLGQVFLSGIFTGMVTTLTLVQFLLYYRLQQIMLESNYKNKLALVNTKGRLTQPRIYTKDMD